MISISWEEWFANDGWGIPLRHVEAEYLQPLRPNEAYEVDLWVDEIGRSWVRFAYEFRKSDQQVATRLKTTHVFVESTKPDVRKRDIPETLRQRLEKALRPAQ